MNKTIGKRIRDHREAKGLSQEELAERLQVSRSTYQRIENGDTNSWVNYMEKLSEILGVSIEDLIRGEESFIQVNRENTTTDGAIGGNVVQHQTINYSLSDKLIEQYEIRISEYLEEIRILKAEIKDLKEIIKH